MGHDRESHIDRLMRAWPVVQRQQRINDRCCILATRTGMAVLAELGIESRPYTCQLLAFNRPAYDLYESHVPVEEWPAHAWSIGVGVGSDDGGWDGHMMLHVGKGLIDLSAAQLHRSGLIEIPGPIRLPYVRTRGVVRRSGLRLLVIRTNAKDYRHANDWRINWQPLVPLVLAEMEEQ